MQFIEDNAERIKNYVLQPQCELFEKISKPNYYPRPVCFDRLFEIPQVPDNTDLFARRDAQSGKIIDFVEETIKDAGATAKNSVSLTRQPGPIEQQTRGNALNYFFWPGKV